MISKEEVGYIAKLSRIEITEKETEKFQKDLSSVLDYFEMLKEVDTKNIKPTYHPLEDYFKENVIREDKEKSFKDTDKVIAGAPGRQGRYFKVKSVF